MTDLKSAPQPSLLARLYERFEGLVREAGKFGTIGAVSFVVDTVGFNLLIGHINSLAAGAISMTVAATVAFIGNRFWTWRDRARTDLRREYALYFLFNLGGLFIALTCLWVSHYGLGLTSRLADNVSKNGIGLVLGTAFRFWSYRQIVFRKPAAAPVGENAG
ncbi:GtrA family protein [Dactylosporangium sp. NPDC051484]|uniref:GtrA family protein n=1 Tax=Dactylosporangium sp. NPDC051484 TaxID=3154942 RepID=UPI00344E6EC4